MKKVSILLATYNPHPDWLQDQLLSLNYQDYTNLELFVIDDGSSEEGYKLVEDTLKDIIIYFPYHLRRNEKNVGSNKTFEELTKWADGDYFAYCDQDDIWETNKISTLVKEIEEKDGLLICSDMRIIDGTDNFIANSITEIRNRHQFVEEDVFKTLLTRNFVTGCTMMVRSDIAKQAIPFVDEMVHDHWLALYAASKGKVISLKDTLVRYRIHEDNQTGVLNEVSDKQSYIDKRINQFKKRMDHIEERLGTNQDIEKIQKWLDARIANYKRESKGIRNLYALKDINKPTTVFEIVALRLPEPLFQVALNYARKQG